MDEPRYFVYQAQARFPSPQSYQIKFASSLQKKVNRDTSKAKSTYFTQLIEQAKGNSKEMWNHLKKIFPSKSNDKSSGSAVLMRDGVSITEPKARAKCLNEFFTSIGRTSAARFNPTIACFSPQRSSTCTSIFLLQNIRQDFVLNQLSYLKPNKAIGLDNVSTRLLKSGATILAPVLASLFNKSITSLEFPSPWKRAKVVALFKSGKKTDPRNYRPISVLPTISKILERAVFKQLYSYLSSNNLLSSNQFGFRPRLSTTIALSDFCDNVLTSMEKGQVTGAEFLDLSKAFDTVDHCILRMKLQYLGVSPTVISWFYILHYIEISGLQSGYCCV